MEKGSGCEAGTERDGVGSSDNLISDGRSNGASYRTPRNRGRSKGLTGPARRPSKANWTPEEDDLLRVAVQKYKSKRWKKIAERIPGRTDVQCLHRWQKVLNPDLVKGPWSKEEDELLKELVEKRGKKKWAEIAEHLPGRIGKQCRERWSNHLDPNINKAAWAKEEEQVLVEAQSVFGNKWSEIAKKLPGRTENSVKNHWNCSLKKKLGNYLTAGFAPNHPQFITPDLHGNNTGADRDFLEAEHLSTNCLPNGTVNSGDNGELSCMNLHLGYSCNHQPSSRETSNPLRPSMLDGTSLDENDSSYNTQGHNHMSKPIGSSSLPETSSNLLPPDLNSPPDVSCSDRNLIMPCPTRPRRYSDICDELGLHQSLSEWPYIGICYEPIKREDLNIFWSTGRFPSTDSYTRQPNRSFSIPLSTSHMQASPDLCTSPESMLRNAALSYDNMPSIIRKRKILTLQKDISTPDKAKGSFDRTLARHKSQEGDDDQVQTSTSACFSSKHQKPEILEAIKSVGKNLERAFSDAGDSGQKPSCSTCKSDMR